MVSLGIFCFDKSHHKEGRAARHNPYMQVRPTMENGKNKASTPKSLISPIPRPPLRKNCSTNKDSKVTPALIKSEKSMFEKPFPAKPSANHKNTRRPNAAKSKEFGTILLRRSNQAAAVKIPAERTVLTVIAPTVNTSAPDVSLLTLFNFSSVCWNFCTELCSYRTHFSKSSIISDQKKKSCYTGV